jgi:nicotinate phosphoribosyltransferase
LRMSLMNFFHFETIIASKAVSCFLAAKGSPLVDFGLRRTHGAEAGILAALASYIYGFAGTSTAIAEKLDGTTIFGIMAHSYIEAAGN